jgi:hypothetical protein
MAQLSLTILFYKMTLALHMVYAQVVVRRITGSPKSSDRANPARVISLASWGEAGGRDPLPLIALRLEWAGESRPRPVLPKLEFITFSQACGKKKRAGMKGRTLIAAVMVVDLALAPEGSLYSKELPLAQLKPTPTVAGTKGKKRKK